MKRTAAILLACAALICTVSGCGKKQDTEKNYDSSSVLQQKSDSYEDALKECFDSIYSRGDGVVFYAYMYPDAAVDEMKASGVYDGLISDFREGKESGFGQSQGKLVYDKIVEAHEINDDQTAAAKRYLQQLGAQYKPDLTEDQLDIKEGYEVTYSYLCDGEPKGNDTVLVVKLNDEGWKILTG